MNGDIFPLILLREFAVGYAFLDGNHTSYLAALSAYPLWAQMRKNFLHLSALKGCAIL